jgi:hypothetical protein
MCLRSSPREHEVINLGPQFYTEEGILQVPIKASPMPSFEELNKQLDYNHEEGRFTWKLNKKGPIRAGMRAGCRRKDGYLSIRVNGVDYLAHRLAWFMFYGSLDESLQIDHDNLDRSDLRISNLRVASHGENSMNTKAKSHNKSGLKGAHLDKRNGLYRARIVLNKKQVWLGYFKTPEEAHAEYCRAASEMHGAFFRAK